MYGIELLHVFKERHKFNYRRQYDNLFVKGVSKTCHFNPNRNYLYCPDDFEGKIRNNSPFYVFNLMRKTTTAGDDATGKTIYFIHFLNWAVYYYDVLTSVYNAMPSDPNQEEIRDARRVTTEMAEIVESVSGKSYTVDEMKKFADKSYKKNNAPLKPAYFLKLCRLFARAWYEEHFCTADRTQGSVEFGYYAGCYIEQSLEADDKRQCKRYDGNSDYWKKEHSRLFPEGTDNIEIHFLHFSFFLERIFTQETSQQKGGYSYTIRISQTGCRHMFDLVARLRLHHYLAAIDKP